MLVRIFFTIGANLLVLVLCTLCFGAAERALVRANLGISDIAWVGQRVPLYVDLMTQTWFSGSPAFDLPHIPGALLLKVQDRPVQGTKRIGGVTYTTQRHEFALFAQRPGIFGIPPFEVRFASAGKPGAPPTEHKLTAKGVKIEAKMPPGAENLSTIISTRDLKVSESWDPQPETAKVGDAFTRRITMRATDVLGMAFPPLPIPKIEGLGVYPREPVVRDQMERGDFIGERVETLTYVCEQPGTVTLPALVTHWWDIDGQELKQETLPAVTLEVTPNPLPATETEAEPKTPASRGLPRWPAGFAILLVVLSAVLWYYRHPVVARMAMWRARRAESEAAYFRRFGETCRSGEAAATMRELMRWIDRSGLGGEAGRLDHFVLLVDNPELANEIRRLKSMLFGRSEIEEKEKSWSGRRLYSAVKRGRRKLHLRTVGYKPGSKGLPDLNP